MTEAPEPIRDIAHLGHVELLTPKPAESLAFFTQVLGLAVTDRQGQSVYLRAYGDYDHCTLKLTEAPHAGLGHVGWRAYSPQALQRRVQTLAALGCGNAWLEGDIGHGPAYQFTDPDGHPMELYYDTQHFQAPAALRSRLFNQPDKYTGQGVAVKRLDHVNLMCQAVPPNRQFLQAHLGFQLHELLQPEVEGIEEGAWLSVTPLTHDLAYVRDFTGTSGRLHHIAYWLDTREDVLRAADLVSEHDLFIEAGPARHNISQAFYLYLYEPGGNRVEIYSGGYLVFAPDWQPIIWRKAERGRGVYWGGTLPASFKTYGTPVIEPAAAQVAPGVIFDPA